MAVFVTLTGRFVNPDGSAALSGGRITFQLVPADVPDKALDETVVPGPVSVPIISGNFSAHLRATDDPDLEASVDGPLVYRVTRTGQSTKWTISLPAPGPWDWTDLTPEPDSDTAVVPGPAGPPGPPGDPGVVALTQAEYDALDPPDPDLLYVITDATGLVTGDMHLTGDLELDGALDHDGSAVGFYGTLPVARPSTVGPLEALETLGLGTSLVLDSPHASNLGTVEGTSTTTVVTPAGLAYAAQYRGRAINARTTSYLALLADAEKIITFNAASPLTLTVPTNAAETLPIGVHIDVVQLGTGQVTVAAGTPGTTTVHGTPGLKLRAQYSHAQLIKLAADVWLLTGDLTA